MRRLILFDIDGTLLSAQGAPRRAFEKALLEVYGTAGPIGTHTFDGKTDPQIARELLTLEGVPRPVIDGRMARLWATYLRELRLELADPGHRTLVYPGVFALLESLSELKEQVVLGLLTGNIAEGAALKLASAGIRTSFRVGAFGSDCESRDGLPTVAVQRALELTGRNFRGADIVVIGDTPNDVTCGRALGVHAVAVTTGRHDEASLRAAGAHAVFADLSQLDAVLDVLLPDGPSARQGTSRARADS